MLHHAIEMNGRRARRHIAIPDVLIGNAWWRGYENASVGCCLACACERAGLGRELFSVGLALGTSILPATDFPVFHATATGQSAGAAQGCRRPDSSAGKGG